MTLPRIFILVAVLLFGAIGIAALFKSKGKEEVKGVKKEVVQVKTTRDPIEVQFSHDAQPVISTKSAPQPRQTEALQEKEKSKQVSPPPAPLAMNQKAPKALIDRSQQDKPVPHTNRVEELFNKVGPQLPIVETITYKSRVAWQKGRPAWLSDYASHYKTSRHFIARSLNGKADYFKQDVADGDRFNVFKEGKNISFHLLVDLSRCKMLLYYIDIDAKERTLLKTYTVGLGREDLGRISGSLTPLGKYSLGNKIAIYKPTMMGYHDGEKVEMIRVFGTRWIPFDKEISNCTLPAKGFGIHGVPWVNNPKGEGLIEDASSVGKYHSDGCIRMSTADIEEVFAITITKPTVIEIVSDFYDAELPGKEKK